LTLAWGRISGESAARGRLLPVIVALIAASAAAIDATVVTRDEAPIRAAGARTVNPWEQ
jgi:predicted nucleic acid-binding protein